MPVEKLAEPRHGLKTPTVIVVEDDFLVRLAIADYLRECGFGVIECSSASEAVSVFKSTSFHVDVVFTDVQMPGNLDGFGLAQWIRTNKPDVKVICTSGVARKAEDAVALCGDGPLIRKPYVHADIERRIRELLAQRERS